MADHLLKFKPGQSVRLTTASKRTVSGRVRIVAPSLDPQTRNGIVYVDLENSRSAASAGMFASGEIDQAQYRAMRRVLAEKP